MNRTPIIIAAAAALSLTAAALAGPYAPRVGVAGTTAIAADSAEIAAWAAEVVAFHRGPQDITKPGSPPVTFGSPADALGPAEGTVYDVVSLGDGGWITLAFAEPITDGPGWDLAVFENGHSDYFLELAHVEVSSNGQDFARFPSVSLTPTDRQLQAFDAIDTTNVHNLAGKYRAGYGTPFDLADLAALAWLDIGRITHVRIVDVVGSIDPAFGSADSLGNMINDPLHTAFPEGGFDLDAVAARYISAAIPGDADGSGTVDFGDFLILSQNWGLGGSVAQGDFDGSGTVDFGDFLILSQNWTGGASPSVPEPATAALLASAGALGLIRRR